MVHLHGYPILGYFISQKYDFGTAYAYLRPFWYNNLTAIADDLPKRKVQHREMLQDVLIEDRIISLHVPPRRIWDLYSNRVVPWSTMYRCMWKTKKMEKEKKRELITVTRPELSTSTRNTATGDAAKDVLDDSKR